MCGNKVIYMYFILQGKKNIQSSINVKTLSGPIWNKQGFRWIYTGIKSNCSM